MQRVISLEAERSDELAGSPRLRLVFEAFLRVLDAATIPDPNGWQVYDVPGAVLLSDHAQKLFNALGIELNRLSADGREVSLQADGSLALGGGATLRVQGSDNPSGPWQDVPAEVTRARAIEITAKSARAWGVLNRAQEVVAFPVQRWNDAQARKPGGPHERYEAGDVITHAELDVLDSVRQLFQLQNDGPPGKLCRDANRRILAGAQSLRAQAEKYVRHSDGLFPGVRALARALRCPKSSLFKAIDASPYLRARKAEYMQNRKRPHVEPLNDVALDRQPQTTEPDPSKILEDLIAEQRADGESDAWMSGRARRSHARS